MPLGIHRSVGSLPAPWHDFDRDCGKESKRYPAIWARRPGASGAIGRLGERFDDEVVAEPLGELLVLDIEKELQAPMGGV